MLSRRSLAKASLAAAAVAGAGSSAARAATRKVATLSRTIKRGKPGRKGYAKLTYGPGERHVVRTNLGVRAGKKRARRRKPIIAFVQLSDVHIIDAQSPARVEWTDRFDDPSPIPAIGLFSSAYRPQEMLSGHIAEAMVRKINQIARGPVTGLRLALAIQTGDNSDNSQLNEIRWNIDVLDGGRVRFDSGDLSRYEGVGDSDPLSYDRAYWHPHGPPAGQRPDGAMVNYGFPRVPGLLDAARRPFQAKGLNMPWYTVLGNHDGLVQGNFPANTLQLNLLATGPAKIMSPPAGISTATIANALAAGQIGELLTSLSLNPGVRLVTPDPDRRLLDRAGLVEEHFTTTGKPRGHGFTATNRREGTAYYHFEKGFVRFIVLDTVNPNGYADGSIDQTQFEWLQAVLKNSAHLVVMVFSHHTSSTMNNPLIGTGGDPTPRVTGDAVLALLLENWEVVAWINGHSHHNEITAHKRERGGGMWEINTASHIDWPQQARIIELTDNEDGTMSIFTTMVDHGSPARSSGIGGPIQLASLAREIAANDWHDRTNKGLGKRRDRNTELLVRMPRRTRKYLRENPRARPVRP